MARLSLSLSSRPFGQLKSGWFALQPKPRLAKSSVRSIIRSNGLCIATGAQANQSRLADSASGSGSGWRLRLSGCVGLCRLRWQQLLLRTHPLSVSASRILPTPLAATGDLLARASLEGRLMTRLIPKVNLLWPSHCWLQIVRPRQSRVYALGQAHSAWTLQLVACCCARQISAHTRRVSRICLCALTILQYYLLIYKDQMWWCDTRAASAVSSTISSRRFALRTCCCCWPTWRWPACATKQLTGLASAETDLARPRQAASLSLKSLGSLKSLASALCASVYDCPPLVLAHSRPLVTLGRSRPQSSSQSEWPAPQTTGPMRFRFGPSLLSASVSGSES